MMQTNHNFTESPARPHHLQLCHNLQAKLLHALAPWQERLSCGRRASHVQLEWDVCLLGGGALEEATAYASEPHLGGALLGDATDVVAALPEDPLHHTELAVILQTSPPVILELSSKCSKQLPSLHLVCIRSIDSIRCAPDKTTPGAPSRCGRRT